MAPTECRLLRQRRRWLFATLPPVLVTVPLLGMAFQLDERLHVYAQIARTDASPPAVASYVAEHTSVFLDHGNFRPAGRFAEVLVHGLVFETAEATGLGPHVALGLVRLAAVAVAALVASHLVGALARSAGVCSRSSLAAMYPLVLAIVLVANGTSGASVPFPHTFVGSVALVGAIALASARDRDMVRRRLRRREYAFMAAAGGLAASFYDLVYVAPVVAAGFLAARVLAQGVPLRGLFALAAFRRWAVLCAGFALVFVPTRIEIARRCARATCYAASEISFSLKAVGVAASRAATGIPVAGWRHNARVAASADLDASVAEALANALLLLLVASMAVLAVRFARHGGLPGAASQAAACDAADATAKAAVGAEAARAVQAPAEPESAPPRRRRFSLALVGLGSLMVLSAAVLAGLSARLQERPLGFGRAWRETLLAQLGWSLVIAGGLVALDIAVHSRAARAAARAVAGAVFEVRADQIRGATWLPVTRVAAAVVLAGAATLTLVANWRLAEAKRHDPTATATSLIAWSAVSFDRGESGNLTRCALIDHYADVINDAPNVWNSAERVRTSLDEMARERYGQPYCDADR